MNGTTYKWVEIKDSTVTERLKQHLADDLIGTKNIELILQFRTVGYILKHLNNFLELQLPVISEESEPDKFEKDTESIIARYDHLIEIGETEASKYASKQCKDILTLTLNRYRKFRSGSSSKGEQIRELTEKEIIPEFDLLMRSIRSADPTNEEVVIKSILKQAKKVESILKKHIK
jgi:hypothetical protein